MLRHYSPAIMKEWYRHLADPRRKLALYYSLPMTSLTKVRAPHDDMAYNHDTDNIVLYCISFVIRLV